MRPAEKTADRTRHRDPRPTRGSLPKDPYIGAIELERGRTNLFLAYFCLAGYSVPGWTGEVASL